MSLRRRINDRKHEQAAADGEPCPLDTRDCEACTRSALEAGIPRSVIMGEKRLRDCFSTECINAHSGRTPQGDEQW